MSNVQPEGNYYDKYMSKNKIVIKLMKGFFSDLDELLSKIKFNKVIEAGCGEGNVTNYIYSNYDCIIKGFDIGDTAIKEAKDNFSSIEFDKQSIYEISCKDDTYDLVVCCEVLEHLENYEAALKELIRISKKYIIVTVPKEPIWRILNICRLKYISQLGNTPGHINHWNKSEFVKLTSKYGEVIEVKNPLPWTMILFKKK